MSFLYSLRISTPFNHLLCTPNVTFLRLLKSHSIQFEIKRTKLMSLMHLWCFLVSENSWNLRVFRVNIFQPCNIFLTNFISVYAQEPMSLSCTTTRNGYLLFVHFPGDRKWYCREFAGVSGNMKVINSKEMREWCKPQSDRESNIDKEGIYSKSDIRHKKLERTANAYRQTDARKVESRAAFCFT